VNEMEKEKLIMSFISTALMVAGICIVTIYGSWPLAIGVFIMLIANKIESNLLYQKKES